MKYEGPAAQMPEDVRIAAERLYGGEIPPDATVEVDSQKRPGWMRIDTDLSPDTQ